MNLKTERESELNQKVFEKKQHFNELDLHQTNILKMKHKNMISRQCSQHHVHRFDSQMEMHIKEKQKHLWKWPHESRSWGVISLRPIRSQTDVKLSDSRPSHIRVLRVPGSNHRPAHPSQWKQTLMRIILDLHAQSTWPGISVPCQTVWCSDGAAIHCLTAAASSVLIYTRIHTHTRAQTLTHTRAHTHTQKWSAEMKEVRLSL